jgi:short subunit dehydrogenase-like uncharacterized protein
VAGRVVLFGATGYTGRLTARALVARGEQPLLAGRNAESLAALSAELGGELETAVADVARPESVAALVESGDVLVSTVGPFVRWGEPAVEAAISRRAAYFDSTGEPGFIRAVFESYGPRAAAVGTVLITAFGYLWVPGNLAGALAVQEAGEVADRVEIGYFFTGAPGMSGGTRATTATGAIEPSFGWRRGIKTERFAARMRSFDVDGRSRPAVSAGSSEHFSLPRLYPGLAEVNAYVGWFGGASRRVQVLSMVGAAVARVPGARGGIRALAGHLVKGSTGGPNAQTRQRSGSHVVAIAYDSAGRQLAEATVAGANSYTFTGAILAWGASRALAGQLDRRGALGPVEAFGLAELEAGCAEAGIVRVGAADA